MSRSNAPCAACRFLRRRCTEDCVFAPHFPSEEPPDRFSKVHDEFGANNVAKILKELQPSQRGDAVNTLVFEAEARTVDAVYGCVGYISLLQKHLKQLKSDLATAKEKLSPHMDPSSMVAMNQPSFDNPQVAAVFGFQPPYNVNPMLEPQPVAGALVIREPQQVAGPFHGLGSLVIREPQRQPQPQPTVGPSHAPDILVIMEPQPEPVVGPSLAADTPVIREPEPAVGPSHPADTLVIMEPQPVVGPSDAVGEFVTREQEQQQQLGEQEANLLAAIEREDIERLQNWLAQVKAQAQAHEPQPQQLTRFNGGGRGSGYVPPAGEVVLDVGDDGEFNQMMGSQPGIMGLPSQVLEGASAFDDSADHHHQMQQQQWQEEAQEPHLLLQQQYQGDVDHYHYQQRQEEPLVLLHQPQRESVQQQGHVDPYHYQQRHEEPQEESLVLLQQPESVQQHHQGHVDPYHHQLQQRQGEPQDPDLLLHQLERESVQQQQEDWMQQEALQEAIAAMEMERENVDIMEMILKWDEEQAQAEHDSLLQQFLSSDGGYEAAGGGGLNHQIVGSPSPAMGLPSLPLLEEGGAAFDHGAYLHYHHHHQMQQQPESLQQHVDDYNQLHQIQQQDPSSSLLPQLQPQSLQQQQLVQTLIPLPPNHPYDQNFLHHQNLHQQWPETDDGGTVAPSSWLHSSVQS